MSSLINCFVKMREGETKALFNFGKDGNDSFNLQGYAIVPLENYHNVTPLITKMTEDKEVPRRKMKRAKRKERLRYE